MLIISRKKDEKIVIGSEIEVTLLEVGRSRVRFGINAPKHIPIQTRLQTAPKLEGGMQTIEIETPISGLDNPSSAID